MIWHLLRYWITFLIPVFYKRIGIKNKAPLSAPGPVIIAMNHPNAFTDPIIITYLCFPTRLKFLARGDAFKPGFATYFLEKLGIVPIFRIQDGGKEGLLKNEQTYQRVNAFLKRNAKLIIFAEGLCVQERRLRPLKKGVARMAFGAYEEIKDERLVVLPVGVNYSMPHQFRSNVFYNVGEPILLKNYFEAYQNNPAKTTNIFLKDLEDQLKPLITHINDKNNDQAVLWMEDLIKADWLKEEGLKTNDLSHDFIITRKITETVNRTAMNNAEVLTSFKEHAANYFATLKQNKFDDNYLNVNSRSKINLFNLTIEFILLLAFSPLYLIALIGNFLPLYFTDFFTRKVIREKEFYSSFALAFGMVFFLINYLLIYSVSHAMNHHAIYSITICILFILAGCFALFYHPRLIRHFALWRMIRNKEKVSQLANQRDFLITLINKMK